MDKPAGFKQHVLAVVVNKSAKDASIDDAVKLRSIWAFSFMPTLAMTNRLDVVTNLMHSSRTRDYGDYVKYSA